MADDAFDPAIVFSGVSFAYPESPAPVFTDFSLELPRGMVSLVGQNGTGKSTLLLLAGARLYPEAGSVTLLGQDTRELGEESEKNRYAAFVYQNMEFDTEEAIGDLLEFVYENGYYEEKDPGFIPELVRVFGLEPVLRKRTGQASKGELQRTIIAFSLLYGSRTVMMDEPIFALEEHRKRRAMEYLSDFSRTHGVSIYYSAHELEITREFSRHMVLFTRQGEVLVGPTEELFEERRIEEAYQVPFPLLYRKEHLYREMLLKSRIPPT